MYIDVKNYIFPISVKMIYYNVDNPCQIILRPVYVYPKILFHSKFYQIFCLNVSSLILHTMDAKMRGHHRQLTQCFITIRTESSQVHYMISKISGDV